MLRAINTSFSGRIRPVWCLCNSVADPVLEFLLFSGIPAGYILQVAGHPADLHYVMATAFRADCLAADWAVLYPRVHLMGAFAVVERAHYLEVGLAAVRARVLVNDEMAGVTLVFALSFRDITKPAVFLDGLSLLCAPFHTTRLQ